MSEQSQPILSSWRATRNPGVSRSTMNIEVPREGFTSGSVRAATKSRFACTPLVMYTLEPFSTQPFPSRRARVRIPCTSEPASGSVTATAGHALAGDDARHVARELVLAARVDEMGRGHVGVHQHRDREAAVGGSPELFGEHHRGERVEPAAAMLHRTAHAEHPEVSELAEHLAGDLARRLPVAGVREDLSFDEAPHLLAQHAVLLSDMDGIVHRGPLSGGARGSMGHSSV